MATEQADENKANTDAALREASEYWGYLIKDDKCGTPILDRLLQGIAEIISTNFAPHDSTDLTPTQLAAFYRAVGGNYDVLFIETPPTSISFIYRSLGAFHSLQPAPDDDGYSAPSIPALKRKGFVTWQTIQLLLGPEEHVPFLQKAVEVFDVKDPETGNVFPKILPKECFPDKPDDAMEEWYETVADRLKREAEADAAEKTEGTRVRVEVEEAGVRTSSEISDGDQRERHGAARYFSDPLYRKARTRPPFVRHFSKPPTYPDDRSGRVVSRVRHMLNPFSRDRRRASTENSLSDDDATPIGPPPPPLPHHHHYPPVSQKRPHPPRRGDSLSTTDSESDSDGPPSRHRSPILRHRSSHEPTSPREYFPSHYYDERDRGRRYSHEPISTAPPPDRRKEDGPPPLYGPTKSPLFATHVAQLQAHNYYDGAARGGLRPGLSPARGSYRPVPAPSPHGVRFDADPPYARERERDRERDGYDSKERYRERDRRRSDEYPSRDRGRDSRDRDRDRDRERGDGGRTKSHDRVKDEWDERDRDRDRDRERGPRDVRARYVPGVDGRRYPVTEPWQRKRDGER